MNVIQGISATREQAFRLGNVAFALRYLPFAMRFELDFDNGKGTKAQGLRIARGSILRLFRNILGFDLNCGGYFDVPFLIDDFSSWRFWIEVINDA